MQNNKELSGQDVEAFCAEMKKSGLAESDRDICRILDINPTTLVRYKKRGVEKILALAFAAAMSELPPYAPGKLAELE